VTATLALRDASDIVEILKFIDRFISDRNGSIERIGDVLNQGLVNATGKNLFANRFTFLHATGLRPENIYSEIESILFNAPGGGLLYIENLKGAPGEIALKIGAENEPFGVINVGDDAKLIKLCGEAGIETGEREFADSLFHTINTERSTINMLIGSKKFTEGWNSWRVSTLGLMNIGATEGAQIIQLFGRGVRLKGYRQSLKRSGRLALPEAISRPEHIQFLETLSIFGIHANYMAQFRDFLEEEGLSSEDEQTEIIMPVIPNLYSSSLKTLRLKNTINGVNTERGDAFRLLGPIPTLGEPSEYLQQNQVVINWYPKISAMHSYGVTGDDEATPNMTHFQKNHIAFLDYDRLYLDLERFKAERGWNNINITRAAIRQLLTDHSWYQLFIPEQELAGTSYKVVAVWQEIAEVLLKKYLERYYSYKKREWELPHLEYAQIDGADPNLLMHDTGEEQGYRIRIESSQKEIIEKLLALKSLITSRTLEPWEFRGIKALWCGQHLYQPLIYLDSGIVEISPVALNKGEKVFVEDLISFCTNHQDVFVEKELYLLRNLSKGKGVGFFEAGNFHPDFIVWLLIGEKQYVTFIDPKGIRNIGAADPKINFFTTIKNIEARMNDETVVLNSFIVSNTPSLIVSKLWNMPKKEILEKNVLFQEEDKPEYINSIFEKILKS
jgi:hypothetical protein